MLHAELQSQIQKTVAAFYHKATTDILIGYHFEKITDWPAHLTTTVNFWFDRLLTTELNNHPHKRSESGRNLIYRHAKLQIRPGQLGRWVILFEQTLNEELTGPAAQELKKNWLKEIHHFQKVFLANKMLWEHIP